jgi:ankyrin repeat protein
MNGQGSRTEKTDKHGGTPLHLACEEGYLNVVQLLVDQGANRGFTPLFYGHLETVCRFEGESSCWTRTPLYWAYREGHHEVMGLLLDEGADKDKADDEGCTRCTMRMRQNWVI